MSEYSISVDDGRLSAARTVRVTGPVGKAGDPKLASSITRKASRQTYYTIKYLVDRPLVDDAYRAYAYFRWVDDTIDQDDLTRPERLAFFGHQQAIIARTYRGELPGALAAEEQLVVDLITNGGARNDGLRLYIENMMAVMAFDARRRGQLVSKQELDNYTRCLATAVTEALHHFIGHGSYAPTDYSRYLAVTAAHITHMLRDTIEDAAAGYCNIPLEFLDKHNVRPTDVNSDSHRLWVQSQVRRARRYFQAGRNHLARVENTRCRFAGYAYIARFELVLEAIEKDDYSLRADYPERKSGRAALKMGWAAVFQGFKNAACGRHQPDRDSQMVKEII